MMTRVPSQTNTQQDLLILTSLLAFGVIMTLAGPVLILFTAFCLPVALSYKLYVLIKTGLLRLKRVTG